jgi:hypothetical protein
MIDRLKEKSRGSNAIGAWVSLAIWVQAKASVRSGQPMMNAIASPSEWVQAQQALAKQAEAIFGAGKCFLTGMTIVIMDDMVPPVVQINARYQGFDGAVASQPMTVQQAAQMAPGKTRAIELE